MKVIDLLNKIANGEEVPEKIKYKCDKYILKNEESFGMHKYINVEKDKDGYTRYLFQDWVIDAILNEEVKIIGEEKKIEKCSCIEELKNCRTINVERLIEKVDEIIDVVNELNKK